MNQARTTTVTINGVDVPTPNCILHTKSGYPPSITADLLEELKCDPLLLHLGISDLYVNK